MQECQKKFEVSISIRFKVMSKTKLEKTLIFSRFFEKGEIDCF